MNARTDNETDGVDDHLGLRPGILLIVDAHRMRDLVDQNPHPRVRRLSGVDDDPLPLVVAPAACWPVDRLERDGEPERASEPLKRLQQMLMRFAAQRLDRRLQRRRLLACRDLGTVKHRHGAKQGPCLARLLAARPVALLDFQWGEDPNRLLALADPIAKLKPRPKPGDERRVRPRKRDQELIIDRIPGQPVPGTHPHPPLPPLRAQQLLSCPLQPFPISAAALVALGLGQPTP